MCTPATKDIVKRGVFSKVSLADINLERVKARAQELDLSDDDARSVDADEIHVSFAALRPFALSPALTDTILKEFDPKNSLRTYYKDGVFYPVPPFTGERLINFPHPIGPMKVYFVPHGETRSFPPNLKVKRVYVRGTFTPKDMRPADCGRQGAPWGELPVSACGSGPLFC